MGKSQIFDTELKTIKKNESITNNEQYQKTPLFEEFDTLSKSYSKLFKQLSRIIKISDMQQEQLKRALKEIEEQKTIVENQNKELLEAERLREDVDHIVRHDLKTPLNAIIGYPQILLKSQNLSEKEKEYIKNISESGYRMLNMINLSLDLFKMERGVYQLNPVPVDVLKVFKNIEAEVEDIRRTKNLTIKTEVSGHSLGEEDTFTVFGEELLCYSMLANLIKNAVEASPEGESISINVDKKESAIVSIHNKGVVPEEIGDKFFEKFTTSGKTTGTGLGTYSAKLIAEFQKGQIGMTTSEEHGTTITIRLPDR